MSQRLEVKNISTRLSDDDLVPILNAVQDQANGEVSKIWETGRIALVKIANGDPWTAGAWRFFVADTPDQVNQNAPGAAGDHDQQGGAPTGYAFVGITLDAGMHPSVTISHEILEMLGDPLIDQYCLWSDVPNAQFLAQELCDPVEDDSFAYPGTAGVLVSDFVTPAYFVPGSAGPWDYQKKLAAPNTLATGGYQLTWDPVNGLQQNAGQTPGGRAVDTFSTPYSRRRRRGTKARQRSKLANALPAAAGISKPRTTPVADCCWWGGLTAVLIVFLTLCGILITRSAWSKQADRLLCEWLLVEAVLIGLLVSAGYLVNRRLDGVLVGVENRISLPRFQWVAWFIVLLGGYFTISVWNVALHGTFPHIQQELLVLLGIVSGSTVVSNVISDRQKNTPGATPPPDNPKIGEPTQLGLVDYNVDPSEACWADLYLGDEVANRNAIDISRLQKLIITILLLFAYITRIWLALANTHGGTFALKGGTFSDMPNIDATFVWLLGISHAAYLGYKATPKTGK